MAKNINRTVTIYINGREVENTLQSIRNEVTKLEREQRKLPIGSEEYIKKGEEIAELKKILLEQKTNVVDLGNTWEHTTLKMAEYSNILMGIQSAFQMLDLGIGKVKDLAKAAAELDDAYGQVMKTTGLTHDEVEQLNELFKKMDTRTSREQLNELAYEAGKLGIQGVKDVAAFVDASDKINVALGDVLGEGAMVTIGKMAQVYAGSTDELAASTGNLQKQMLAIGSAVNELGKLSTANEHYLVDFAGRMGGIAVQAGLSADQILGFASALDQDMQKVEMSATAFQKFIGQIMKKPEEFAKQAGMAVSDFSQLVRTDLNEALFRVLQGFSGKGGYAELVNIFKDLGLDGARAASVISAMSNSIDKIKVAQAAANEQLKSGESIMGEYNTMNNTGQAQAEKAKKRFEEVRIELGNELYPVLISLQRSGTVLMKGVAGVAQLLKSYPVLIAPIIAGLIAWNRYRIVSIVTSGRLVNALKTVTGIKKIEAAATAFQAKSDAKLRAEEEASRLQTLKNQLAIEKENLARQKSKVGMEAQSLVLTNEASVKKMETAVTNQATVAEQAHANAIKAKRAAWMAMPWGLIITSLASIGTALYSIWKNSDRVKLAQVMRDAAKEAGEAEGKVKVLFERLKDAAAGSEAYKSAVDDLKAAYPDLIAKHVDEEGKIRNLSAAYNELSAAARQSVYDRMYADKVSETQGDIANSMAKRIEKVSKWIDKAGKELSEAERTYMKQQFNTLFSEASTGAANTVEIMKRANDILVKNGIDANGFRSRQIKDQLMQMMGESKITQKNLDALRVDMGANSPDPFGVQKMSLEQLNSELAKAERLLKSYRKQIDNGRDGYAEKLDSETKKIAALREQIAKLQNDKKNETETTTNGDYDTTGETEKERKEREKQEAREAKRIADAWQKAQDDAKKMTDKFNLQAESGLQKVKDDVDSKTEEMIARLRETAEEARESADDLEKNLKEAAENYKESQVLEYLNKVTVEVEKIKKTTDKSEEGERLNKVSQAAENLRRQLGDIDNMITKLETDQSREIRGGGTYNELEERIKELKAAKRDAVSAAFSSLDFKVENPFKEQSRFDLKDIQARALDEVKKKVEEYSKAIDDAVAAYSRMAEAARSAGNEDKAKEYEAEAAALKKQSEGIEDISKKAEELAKKNALKETLDAWCDGIQQFTDQALSIFSNINSLLDNIADSELQKMERQKESAIENLDEQLEQGLISQEEYEESKESLEDEYDEKEKEVELEQWRRQKALDVSQAIIGGALAAVRAYAEGGPYAGPFLAAMVAAATGIQIAAIENQPEPYAKGGYVPKRTVYQAGEAGPEWVASNTLLSDPATAPIIEKLEDYQRGNRRALSDIPMAALDMPAATAAAEQIGRNRVVVQPQSAAAVWEHPTAAAVGNDSREMVNLMRELVTYEKDPRNRQAVISRRTMDDFNNNENFLRNRARL